MTKKITLEIELDDDLKAEAEKLYSKIHLTLEEAIPILIKYNVEQQDGELPKKTTASEKNSAFGALAKYANPALIPFEDGAWERTMVKKYVASLG